MEWLVGGIGFLLFFLYDWNRVFWKCKWMSHFFLLGCLCQAAAGICFLWGAWESRGQQSLLFLAAALVFLAGLVYTLFFALPFDSTYCREADKHQVCRSGLYGLCRHPGVWWFFGCFLCLGMACAAWDKIIAGIGLSILNLGYAWYQDKWIFPEEFYDYREYQKAVPFLFPMRQGRGEK